MKRINKNAVSLAGEFAVLSQLALRGYDANMTLGHTKGVDILVHSPNGELYKLEVKTTFANRRDNKASISKVFGTTVNNWMMSPTLFYCFVSIARREGSAFNFYIVPSKVVAQYVAKEHRHWLREKKREGKSVKDSDMRLFRIGLKGAEGPVVTPTAEQYENNWDFED